MGVTQRDGNLQEDLVHRRLHLRREWLQCGSRESMKDPTPHANPQEPEGPRRASVKSSAVRQPGSG